jgi:hypothetical protein
VGPDPPSDPVREGKQLTADPPKESGEGKVELETQPGGKEQGSAPAEGGKEVDSEKQGKERGE